MKYKEVYAHPASIETQARVLPCNSLAPKTQEIESNTDKIVQQYDEIAKK